MVVRFSTREGGGHGGTGGGEGPESSKRGAGRRGCEVVERPARRLRSRGREGLGVGAAGDEGGRGGGAALLPGAPGPALTRFG